MKLCTRHKVKAHIRVNSNRLVKRSVDPTHFLKEVNIKLLVLTLLFLHDLYFRIYAGHEFQLVVIENGCIHWYLIEL